MGFQMRYSDLMRRQRIESEPCTQPGCDAKPGEWCITATRRKANRPHRVREEAADAAIRRNLAAGHGETDGGER